MTSTQRRLTLPMLCRIFFEAQTGGLPAVPELGWSYIPEGAIFEAKKDIYGTSGAPLLWYEHHTDTIFLLPGAARSTL